MKIEALAMLLLAVAPTPYRVALPGYRYEFPRDHFSHPEFQTEWWYYTGNLHAADGHRYGFELTFFRHGVDRTPARSVWDVQDVWMAHLALSDIDGNRFFHIERLNRAGAGLAGADLDKARVWNGNWSVQGQHVSAIADRFQLSFDLTPQKPAVIHGANGVSQKSAGQGHASHYISSTRMAARGAITIDGKAVPVEGLSWMDHEFFTHQLEANQIGWDWFGLQFDDGTELMLFRGRRSDGSVDPFSAGTYIDEQGHTRHLKQSDFTLTPGKTWMSPDTRAQYPIAWTIRVPAIGFDGTLTTRLPQQELTGGTGATSAYWEGAIEVAGMKRGVGYLEMTGYAGPVRMGE